MPNATAMIGAFMMSLLFRVVRVDVDARLRIDASLADCAGMRIAACALRRSMWRHGARASLRGRDPNMTKLSTKREAFDVDASADDARAMRVRSAARAGIRRKRCRPLRRSADQKMLNTPAPKKMPDRGDCPAKVR
ncbi:hypothetical protein [Burkholderia oklahomensis]|uniref:hypothetical protein n=1 Tax=Burkholderia oklahomensis TaxID=342113 RepID=UPI00130EED9F|nr:hypothetical protein [Burkholderia oklahomensis]MBI0362717.1 hypothetical protein [Burkholderia oklahomensis]